MELSLFLAKLLGIYLLIVATVFAVRRREMSRVVDNFFASRSLVFLSGLLALATGIAMAVGHCVWEWNWRGMITVFGYLSIAKGVVRIGWPAVPQRAVGVLLNGSAFWIWIGMALVLGGYLTWAGFTLER